MPEAQALAASLMAEHAELDRDLQVQVSVE
jgi:hypothetical protein